MYKNYLKRLLDSIISICALIVLSPLLLVLIICGTIAMRGNPFFTQLRPGKDERLFKLIKFRTMNNQTDCNGNLCADEIRMNHYGAFLRSTSLDELPELWNIFIGDMALVGPRPQLIRDMVFMTKEHRKRHSVRQGLTGLAQVSGRNGISWDEKLDFDIEYIKNITFTKDIKIIISTFNCVFHREGINRSGTLTDIDYGQYLLINHKITNECFKSNIERSKEILANYDHK